ncbi:hypothetical protein LXL04_006939 [Taraxacum kok-saghyz]
MCTAHEGKSIILLQGPKLQRDSKLNQSDAKPVKPSSSDARTRSVPIPPSSFIITKNSLTLSDRRLFLINSFLQLSAYRPSLGDEVKEGDAIVFDLSLSLPSRSQSPKAEMNDVTGYGLGSFENSYIPEKLRTPKPLTFSKNRLREAKNRSNTSPGANFFFRKTIFFFKNFTYVQKKNKFAHVHVFLFCFKNAQIPEIILKVFYRSLYNTYFKKNFFATGLVFEQFLAPRSRFSKKLTGLFWQMTETRVVGQQEDPAQRLLHFTNNT